MKKEEVYVIYKDGKPYISKHQKIKTVYKTRGAARSVITTEVGYVYMDRLPGKTRNERRQAFRAMTQTERDKLEAAVKLEFDIVAYTPAAGRVTDWLQSYIENYDYIPASFARDLLVSAGVSEDEVDAVLFQMGYNTGPEINGGPWGLE